MHAAPQILRVHLAEPRNGYFRLTAHTATNITNMDSWILALEPSKNLVITTNSEVRLVISDWIRGWEVEIPSYGVGGGQISVGVAPWMSMTRRDVLRWDE